MKKQKKLPARYQRFLASKEYVTYNGRFVTRLPSYSGSTKLRVRFDDPALADVDWGETDHRGFVPLTLLGEEAEFLAIDARKPECPVRMWEHESGKLVPVADSLDAFLKSLIAKGEPTPFRRVKSALTQANKLAKSKRYAEAQRVLDAALDGGDPGAAEGDDEKQALVDAFNARGLCKAKLGASEEAIADFEQAIAVTGWLGDCQAPRLNIAETLCYGLRDYPRAVAYAKKLKLQAPHDLPVTYPCNVIIGYASLKSKKAAQADQAYREIDAAFYRKEDREIRDVVKQVKELAKEGNTHAAKVLGWFAKVASPTASDDDRAWWASLDVSGTRWKTAFKEALDLNREPTDADLSQIPKRVTRLPLDRTGAYTKEEFKDLLPLKRLSALTDFSCKVEGISIDAIRDATGLDDIGLEYCDLADLAPLAGLKKLTRLFLDRNRIKSLAPLAELTELETLTFAKNEVEDLSPLADCRKLEMLRFRENKVRSLEPLRKLTKLKELVCGDHNYEGWRGNKNQVSDLSPIAGLLALEELDVADNQIKSLEALAGLRSLTKLDVQWNPIADLTPLAKLPKLARLTCNRVSATDLSVLASFKSLQVIEWSSSHPLTGLLSLATLRSLKSLRLSRASVPAAEVAKFKKLRRDVKLQV